MLRLPHRDDYTIALCHLGLTPTIGMLERFLAVSDFRFTPRTGKRLRIGGDEGMQRSDRIECRAEGSCQEQHYPRRDETDAAEELGEASLFLVYVC